MKLKITFLLLIAFLFTDCKSKQNNEPSIVQLSSDEEAAFIEKGKMIAANTFSVLAGQLQKSMGAGGVQSAIQYCNTAAYPLTDSLSLHYEAKVKRTSIKYRNPDNAPTEKEKQILLDYEYQVTEGESPQPEIKVTDRNTILFHAPIFVNEFCLNCHGIPGQTMQLSDFEFIKKYYPSDLATGYVNGDLRGIWSIELSVKPN